ncbi:hypothetical protein LL912_01965 [Niabella sp. CC-SYL272]|uniref:hypothetical protein n=1 Tax=Niabella agricola TaxID=2891571 RepID=UPI001F36EFA6|nr:hypothetical protein [Niabella agricola]MCF3107535.1 hypothetical protein [Niabella agricola]
MNSKLARLALFVFLLMPLCLTAQVVTTIEQGAFYTALAMDRSGNVYVTRHNLAVDRYEVVKYIKGTGIPQVLYSGLQYNSVDYPWGLAIAGNGDVYIAASNIENKIIKLPYNSSNNTYGMATTFVSGHYYSALAMDQNDNLYTLEYAAGTADYAIVKYPAGSSAGIQLYHGLLSGPGFQYPTGLAVAPNGDVFTTESFDDGTISRGAVYRFTASSGYATRINISSNKYSTALALDPQGTLYVSEYNGSTYVLNRYINAAGGPVKVQDLEMSNGFYPWGIVALNSRNLWFATGSSSGSSRGGALKYLIGTPEMQASNITSDNVGSSSMTLNWTNGSGVVRTVFMAKASSGTPAPVSGAVYPAGSVFGSGTQIGSSGWYSVYRGTGNTVTVNGLDAFTTYRAMVIEDNGNNYYQTMTFINNPVNITTAAALPVSFGAVSALVSEDKLNVNWSTESETRNDHFEIQASVDGKNFRSIGTVASQAVGGNSNTRLDYQFEKARNMVGLALFPFIIGLLGFAGKRRRRYALAGVVMLAVAVSVISCTKRETTDTGEIEKLFIRIAQVDKDGIRTYSKVVAAVQKN